jgi:hypothetical protein
MTTTSICLCDTKFHDCLLSGSPDRPPEVITTAEQIRAHHITPCIKYVQAQPK